MYAPPADAKALSVSRAYLLELQHLRDHRGSLIVTDWQTHLTFPVQRMYSLVDTPVDAERGAHAHRALHQLYVVLQGSMDLIIDDGHRRCEVTMNRPDQACFFQPMLWREMRNFAPHTVLVVLASDPYDADDYIRSYDTFKAAIDADA